MKKQLLFFGALIFGIVLSGCNSDDDLTENNVTAKILSFEFLANNNDDLQADVIAVIDQDNKTITATLPANTSVSFLRPTIKLSEEASVFPSEDFPKDFTNTVKYRVFGDNFDETEYLVTVIVEDSQESKINNFIFRIDENPSANLEADTSGTFDDTTITLEFNAGVNITTLVPNITISQGATITPESGVAQDFTNPIEYTVTAQDGTTKKTYRVVATVLPSDKKEITSFVFADIDGKEYKAAIEGTDIMLELPEGTNLSSLVPSIEISLNATISPKTNVVQDFTSVVNYEVTAEDETKQKYTVNVYTINSAGADRAVLTKLYHLNKKLDNLFLPYLNWDLGAPTMENWTGVTLKNDRVSTLILTNILSYRIYELPEEIGKLSALQFLTVNSPNLNKIPASIGSLNGLLDLSINANLSEIPKEIGNLEKLGFLRLDGNVLTSIPEEIGNLKELFTLDLRKNKLTSIPRSIANLDRLSTLNVHDNELTEIPNEITELRRLRRLDISKNKIKVLPTNISNLDRLETFELFENQLETLPSGIGALNRLKELNLSKNNLQTLPDEITALGELVSLNVSENKLASLPVDFEPLNRLENLDFSMNQLKEIPVSIGELSRLKELNLSSNVLELLPASIGELRSLRKLNIKDNPFNIIPKSVCDLTFLTIEKDDEDACEG